MINFTLTLILTLYSIVKNAKEPIGRTTVSSQPGGLLKVGKADPILVFSLKG